MDQDRFDALTKDLAGHRTRRGVLKGLAGAALGALAGVAGLEAAGANPPPKKCKYQDYNCKTNADCCSLNCCNRTCCGDGQICTAGQCVFPTTTTTPAPTTTTTPAPTTTTTPKPTTTTTPAPVAICTPGPDASGNPGLGDSCAPIVGQNCKAGCNCFGGGGVGFCVADCVACGGQACVDLGTDPNNCGACGAVCGANQVCSNGVCIVVATCTDGIKNGTETDIDCGGGACPACKAGSTCVSGMDCQSGSCVNGVCGPGSCPQGGTYVYCPAAGMCFPLDKDPNNCGACGNVCSAGATCQSGVCV